jgi:hypothetical protein
VLSRAINDLEPTLTLNSYDTASLASQLKAQPPDARAFLARTLDPEHALKSTKQLSEAGVPCDRTASSSLAGNVSTSLCWRAGANDCERQHLGSKPNQSLERLQLS